VEQIYVDSRLWTLREGRDVQDDIMKASRNNNSLEYSLYQTLTCHNETKMYLFIVSLEEEATHTHTKPGGSTLSRNEQIKTTRTPAHTGTILLAANAASFLAEIIVLTTNFMQAGRVCSHSLVLPVDTLLRQLSNSFQKVVF